MTAFKRSETVTASTSLVTTDTAQDITGVKTFSNGMKGRTDGGIPSTGYIGEVKEATITATTASTTNTAVTLNQGLVLGVGTWEIYYSLGCEYDTGANVSDRGQIQTWVYENGVGIGTDVGVSRRALYVKTVAAVSNVSVGCLAYSQAITITSGTKDYRLGCIRIDSGIGSGIATVLSNSTFYAIRRA